MSGCADDAGKGGHRPDRKIKTAENDGEGHAAGDDSDDRVLLQDIDEVLIGPEGRRRHEHAGDEQDEGDQDAVAPGERREPAPATKGHAPVPADAAAPVIMLTISSGMRPRRLAIPDDAPAAHDPNAVRDAEDLIEIMADDQYGQPLPLQLGKSPLRPPWSRRPRALRSAHPSE